MLIFRRARAKGGEWAIPFASPSIADCVSLVEGVRVVWDQGILLFNTLLNEHLAVLEQA